MDDHAAPGALRILWKETLNLVVPASDSQVLGRAIIILVFQ